MPIFDQGYQHWQGTLSGHGWRWLAVARHGSRAGMQNRFLRLLLLSAVGLAVVLAGGVSLWGFVEQKHPIAVSILSFFGFPRELFDDPVAFRLTAWTVFFHIFLLIDIYYIMILVVLVGPSLISQDLRFNALPLYFSRPLTRFDYFLGKLAVIAFFLGLVTVVPALLAWVLGVLCSLDFRAVVHTFSLLMGLILFGIIVALSAGLLILAMSSLSRNSRYVAFFWAGMWFITGWVSTFMVAMHRDAVERQAFLEARNQQDRQDREEQVEAQLRQDWRPIISYTANLQRLGFALIDSQGAWKKVDELSNSQLPKGGFGPRPSVRVNMTDIMVPQFPWYWSALVLLALGGASMWILHKRVTSLDRLK